MSGARPAAGPAPLRLSERIVYPESPRWRDGELWFSDVHDYAVKRVTADGFVHTVVRVPSRPAGLGFLPDGRLLIAGALDRCLWTWDGDTLALVADLSDMTRGLLNDMVVDGAGRAFVGDTGFNLMAGEQPRPGQVILAVEDPGTRAFRARVVTRDVVFPNGAAVSPDGRAYWVAETAAHRVSRFRVTADGDLVARRTVAELPDMPDGLCLDETGALWVALLRRGEFRRVGADGTTTDIVSADGRLAVACTLGGHDRRTLYLCSAATTMADLARGVSSGLIHTMTAASGAGWP
ncbi:SMP-30/gluconolactonase/LRE family protein [Streptomyces sp. NPDC007264]|uniref:SMP-30/gluconolactonase/LRE family protein n=1 Tax=Streptomyces sp. NPDC007264 TaxID=3364777 RepID=UPI0036DECF89